MAEEKEKNSTMAKRVFRKLFPAYFALLLLLSAGWIAVTFLGSSETKPDAAVRMDLSADTAAHHGEAAHGDAAHDGHGDSHANTAGSDLPDANTPPQDPHAGHDHPPIPADNAPADAQGLTFGLKERVGLGSLPRIASDGTTPMQAYAAKAPESHEPKIAIVLGHLGISDSTVQDAENLLPKEITFAFSPYATEIDKLARQAHENGHEVLIEIPMEPEDYPINDAGPYTLRTEDSNLVMLQHLTWVMTRASYYVGLTNDQGQRFLASSDAVSPVLKFIHRRGLMFFENNTNRDSKADTVARGIGMPYARANEEIDATLTPQAIDARLEQLVEIAKKHGSATAYARPYPLTLEQINRWAATLKRKGVVLTPLTAVVSHHKQEMAKP